MAGAAPAAGECQEMELEVFGGGERETYNVLADHCKDKHNDFTCVGRGWSQTNQHTCPPIPVSNTAFKKEQGEGAASDTHPTLHTGNGLSILFNPPPPQGAPPPWLGTFQLASSLAAGLRLFGPWRDFASCSCRCLSVYEDDSCMSLPGLFC